MAGKYVLNNTTNGGYHFTLNAANGEPILSSETYTSKSGATNGIDSVKSNSPDDARYERKQAANGQYMFNLKAANGERIGSSETYKTESARENGIASVKANGPAAATDDRT